LSLCALGDFAVKFLSCLLSFVDTERTTTSIIVSDAFVISIEILSWELAVRHLPSIAFVFAAFVASLAFAAEDEPKWQSLFNGKDLKGWERVNCAPETFTVREEMIISTGVPTGVLRSDKMYENFELELEWRHMKAGGNAGLFVWSDPVPSRGVPFTRSIEVQILDGVNTANYTSHGDLFSIHGATLTPIVPHPQGWPRSLPSERRAKPSPEWNHYRVTCRNGEIQLAVNGKVVSGGSKCLPRKGYICLEAEGSECHFRNLKIREFPSTNPKPEEIAPEAANFRSLYTGIDLAGWKGSSEKAGWKANDWKLVSPAGNEASLTTTEEFGDCILMCDWRLTDKPQPKEHPVVLPTGEIARDEKGNEKRLKFADAGRVGLILRGHEAAEIDLSCRPQGSGGFEALRSDAKQSAEVRRDATPRKKADLTIGQWNRLVVTIRGRRTTVTLNGEPVIEEALLPNLPARGPFGLVPHGAGVEFATIMVKTLD